MFVENRDAKANVPLKLGWLHVNSWSIRPHGRQLVTKATGEKKRVQSKLL